MYGVILRVNMNFERENVFPLSNMDEIDNTIRAGDKYPPVRDYLYTFTIRIIDILFSLAVLIIVSPLLLLIALLIKFDTPGPVIFKHQRVGYNRRKIQDNCNPGQERRGAESFGKPFIIYKFRTMYADAKERFPELYKYSYTEEELQSLPINVLVGTKSETATIDESDDPRLTKVGKWLRRTSLDELPNFFNVLKGDMHLVGPRPDIHENIKYYTKNHLKIFDVKPGITGLAQIQGRKLLLFNEINEFDMNYVENRSLLLDLKILFKTAIVCLRGDGAY
jgi:lipopolysaccharide/colanic/teichoic acid biosynthesis glycosyltransferase